MRPTADQDALLANVDWLRRLADALVHNRADAEDLVQSTWLTAMRHGPDPARPARPWLGQVLRNVFRMDVRANARRQAREGEMVWHLQPDSGTTADVLERLQLQKTVVGLLVELEEPYRSALTSRFFEGRSPPEIAREQGVPEGTARWRINEGLRRLRNRLDEAHGGRKDDWRKVLLPLAAPDRGGPPRAGPVGVGARATFIVGLGVIAAGVAAIALWNGSRQRGHRSVPELLANRPVTTAESVRERPPNASAGTAASNRRLPALTVAEQEPERPLQRQQLVDLCLELREKAVPTKEELAAMLAIGQPIQPAIGLVEHNPLMDPPTSPRSPPSPARQAGRAPQLPTPPGHAWRPVPPATRRGRAPAAVDPVEQTVRTRLAQAIVEAGTGPLSARRENCLRAVEASAWFSHMTGREREAIWACDVGEEQLVTVLQCRLRVFEEVSVRAFRAQR
jgi:RNA polymerase sigma factor (sigma-70 family)